jgi:hypothetical protein
MPLFDFEAAVTAPFRMQPGLRRVGPGQPHLTPLVPGSQHQREKLAVLSAYSPKALCSAADLAASSAAAALAALCMHAAAEHPGAWSWDGRCARALRLGTAVTTGGDVQQFATGVFGLGDEVARCLQALRPRGAWPGC